MSAVPARKLAPRAALTTGSLMRLMRFPYIRKEMSGALYRLRPIAAELPTGSGSLARFRVRMPTTFHPALFATIPAGERGTLLVIGTPKVSIKKRAALEAFLARMGWNSRSQRWTRPVSSGQRRSMIYQLRRSGILGPAATQAVLVPEARVRAVAARFLQSLRLRRVAVGANTSALRSPATATHEVTKLKRDRERVVKILSRPMSARVFQQMVREVGRINRRIRILEGKPVEANPRKAHKRKEVRKTMRQWGMRSRPRRNPEHDFQRVSVPPHFSVRCFVCKRMVQTAQEPLYADLKGPSFKAYYCTRCKCRLSSVKGNPCGTRRNPILATLGINPPTVQNIRIPFRTGQSVTTAQIERWIQSLPKGDFRSLYEKRFADALRQYRRFHKGAQPKTWKWKPVPMGASRKLTDIDFVVSEGNEWSAAYQVPKHSRKYDPKTAGRYLHAHGESGIDIAKIAHPARRSKLPERFHTADGRFVGVIPSRNVRITDWYRG